MLEEAKGKMSGYVALVNYRYMNLCIKAEPASLLSITIELDGVTYNMEDVADVARPREDQLALYPKENNAMVIFAICKGIKLTHPEFKVEVKNVDEDEQDDEAEKYILLTMPEVDENRRDLINEGVDTLQKACQAKLDKILNQYAGLFVTKLANAKPEEMDEAKDAIQELYDQHKDLLNSFGEEKKAQAEAAYQRYMAQQEAAQEAKQEENAAHNQEVAYKMKMGEEDE